MVKINVPRKYEGGDNNKKFQELIHKLCNDAAFRASVKSNHEILSEYELTPFQITTLIAIGHETGQYSFTGGPGCCCCCGTNDMTQNLGPLTLLAGTWEGDKGYDTAPSEGEEPRITKYREQIKFKPIGPVNNYRQVLYGLEYSTKIWRLDNDKQFHEEVGYLLWDFQRKQVLRCFIVPRGVTVMAGGTVEADANTFKLFAEAGSDTYGICSNKFLDEVRKTLRHELKVTIHDDRSFSYYQDTQLQIKGRAGIFHHTDMNTLLRTK